jgi:hypothetical protein
MVSRITELEAELVPCGGCGSDRRFMTSFGREDPSYFANAIELVPRHRSNQTKREAILSLVVKVPTSASGPFGFLLAAHTIAATHSSTSAYSLASVV